MTMAAQLDLEWQADPESPRGGVEKGALAWCACGWRRFETASTGTDPTSGRRLNQNDMAERALDRHRERCPWRPIEETGEL